ncbi:AAA+ ATPase domain-containing protein [Madurella fahalii]|uniref:AAA+ ATPase domain-containing protein n=1 Tax=Madurella fahalii TaxID=1157608 RepID=A0ABQ0G5Z6_9PEZI
MADAVDAPPRPSLLEKLAAIEKRLAELEQACKCHCNKVIEVALAPKDEGVKKDELAKADVAAGEVKEDKEPGARIKVVVSRKDPATGEAIEEDSKLKKASDGDADGNQYAFILRKIVFEAGFSPNSPQNSSEIDITNPHLWSLLKQHLSYYPYHIFRDAPVALESPYEAIIFQFDELEAAAAAEKPGESDDERQARGDLKLLLETISGGSSGDEKLDKYFKMRPKYKSQKPEAIQFEDLWTIFPPGQLVYGRPFQGEHQVFVVKDNKGTWPWLDRSGRKFLPWKLDVWSYDWKDGSFGRTDFTLNFDHFDGHLPLLSLPYYPFELHPENDAVRADLIKRGKRFREVCEAKHSQRLFEYKGKAISEKKGLSGMRHGDDGGEGEIDLRSSTSLEPFEYAGMMMGFGGFGGGRGAVDAAAAAAAAVRSSEVQSRVMVDYESYFTYGQAERRNGPLASAGVGTGCACSDCINNEELARRYRIHFDDPQVAGARDWDDEQYLLCPPRVLGYILDQKQWAQLQVTLLDSLAPEEDSMDAWNSRLKLADDSGPDKRKTKGKKAEAQSTKDLLFDLVRSHVSSTAEMSNDNEDGLEVDDIIPGKGKGLVILLYGPPGVGKTSTAETIAIATKKPLFSVSVADVGTQAKHVESNLSRIFALATRWQAILLIDEADVFLESRGRGSAIRSTDKNALVSVFLRVLEYYQGIMFLTTNQIAEFDIAIPSRIHVSIQYESLKDYQMEAIFHGFLEPLDKRKLIEDYDGIKEWLEEVVYKEKLDGRQIRNTVTTALGLARAEAKYRHQGGRLRKDHLKRAFGNVSAFKRDFNTQWERYKESQKQLIK